MSIQQATDNSVGEENALVSMREKAVTEGLKRSREGNIQLIPSGMATSEVNISAVGECGRNGGTRESSGLAFQKLSPNCDLIDCELIDLCNDKPVGVLYVRASEVASLCGWGRFLDENAAFFDLLTRNEPWKSRIPTLARSMSLVSPSTLLNAAAPPEVLRAAAVVAAQASSAEGLRDIVKDTVLAAEPAITKVARGDEGVAKSLREGITTSVIAERGNILENAGLDSRPSVVHGRNDQTYTMSACHGRIKLAGRVDGLERAENSVRVVEVKTRTRTMASAPARPPQADYVQVRAYMELLRASGENVTQAILVEQFVCGKRRDTAVFHDQGLWNCIECELERVVGRFASLTDELVLQLMRSYWSKRPPAT